MRAIIADDVDHRRALGWRRGLVVCAFVAFLLLALGRGTSSGAVAEPILQFLNTGPLSLTAPQNGTSVATNITVQSTGAKITDLTFSVVSSNGTATSGKQIKGPETLDAYSATTFQLNLPLSEAGSRGWIVASSASSQSTPASLAYTIASAAAPGTLYVPVPSGWRLDVAIALFALGAALFGIVSAWIYCVVRGDQRDPKIKPWPQLPLSQDAPKLVLTGSWVSNVTVLGGILGLISGAGGLPGGLRPQFADAGMYVVLAAVFAAFALIAPLPYAVFTWTSGSPPAAVTTKGRFGALMLTTLITLWSLAAQLLLVIAVLSEVERAGLLGEPIVKTLVALIYLIAVGVFTRYSWRTVWDQLDQGVPKPPVPATEAVRTGLRQELTKSLSNKEELRQIPTAVTQASVHDAVHNAVPDANVVRDNLEQELKKSLTAKQALTAIDPAVAERSIREAVDEAVSSAAILGQQQPQVKQSKLL